VLPLAPERLEALYGAFAALDRARRERGALELDLTEHRVVLDAERRPTAIVPRHRLDSHRLIEEFMILANVAAAEELEGRHQPCMYRVHDAPGPEKLDALRDFFDELGIPGLALAKGQVIRPSLFNRILEKARDTAEAPIVNELVLRSQAQAVYSPNNIGHFGLALPRYAHFTSPIRRYADLVVQRWRTAPASRPVVAGEPLAAIAEHISMTERRAASAERAALDRYRATLLGSAIGTVYEGRITGVAPFGFFVSLPESGADGLVPISTLPSDYYDHDPRKHRLLGRRSGRQFALGDAVTVRLAEADPIGGRLLFRVEGELASPSPASGAGGGRAAAADSWPRRLRHLAPALHLFFRAEQRIFHKPRVNCREFEADTQSVRCPESPQPGLPAIAPPITGSTRFACGIWPRPRPAPPPARSWSISPGAIGGSPGASKNKPSHLPRKLGTLSRSPPNRATPLRVPLQQRLPAER
jgi:ribonuclease R